MEIAVLPFSRVQSIEAQSRWRSESACEYHHCAKSGSYCRDWAAVAAVWADARKSVQQAIHRHPDIVKPARKQSTLIQKALPRLEEYLQCDLSGHAEKPASKLRRLQMHEPDLLVLRICLVFGLKVLFGDTLTISAHCQRHSDQPCAHYP